MFLAAISALVTRRCFLACFCCWFVWLCWSGCLLI